MAEVEMTELEKFILDSNARWMMEIEFDKEKIETVVQVTSKNLGVSENKAKALLSKTIKDILQENSKEVLEELKPVKKKRKKKEENEQANESQETQGNSEEEQSSERRMF